MDRRAVSLIRNCLLLCFTYVSWGWLLYRCDWMQCRAWEQGEPVSWVELNPSQTPVNPLQGDAPPIIIIIAPLWSHEARFVADPRIISFKVSLVIQLSVCLVTSLTVSSLKVYWIISAGLVSPSITAALSRPPINLLPRHDGIISKERYK